MLRSLNRAVQHSGTDTFLTAVFGILDLSAAAVRLHLACGGHPLPIHVRSGSTTTIGRPGTLLGVFTHGRFEVCEVDLKPGDVVVFYTDGATDIPPPNLRTASQFAELVGSAARQSRTAAAIADRLRDAPDAIQPFSRRHDDVALLVVRIREIET